MVMLFALLLSSVSAILTRSARTGVVFAVSFDGDSWLGVTTSNAPVSPVSVSACICASVGISTLPATVVLAFAVDHVALFVRAQPM